MADFTGMWGKMNRAKQHVSDLETAVVAFHKANPYPVIIDDNPKMGTRAAKLGGPLTPIPREVPVLVGDAIHNLRSALDHFMYAAVAAPSRATYFPVFSGPGSRTAKELKALVHGKTKGASPDLTKALLAIEPYSGGNGEYLWVINDLDITDKHRLLLTIGTAFSAMTLDLADLAPLIFPDGGSFPLSLRPSDRYPLKEGTELYVAPPGEFEKHRNLKFTFDIAFGEPKVLEGEPIVPTLRRLIDEVEGLLQRLIGLA